MKNLQLTFLLTSVLFLNAFAQDGWFYQSPNPTFENLHSVSFIDENMGWAVGTNNTIINTTNGGGTWTSQHNLSEVILNSVHFINHNYGWVAGYYHQFPAESRILFTTDGGESWTSANLDHSVKLNDIFFLDQSTGYSVGEEATVLKSTDGGLNWVDVGFDSSYALISLFFIDDSTGWITGNFQRIYKTTNGGVSWETQSSSHYMPHYSSIYFLNTNMGWATGGDIAAITYNGGTAWQQVSTGHHSDQSEIAFVDENTGYIAGKQGYNAGFILKSTDGGNSWIESYTREFFLLNSLSIATSNDIYVVGEKGVILATSNGGNQWQTKTDYIESGLTAVCFTNENIGWTSGYHPGEGSDWDYRIYKSTDGGNSWSVKDSLYKVRIEEFCSTDELNCWAAAKNLDNFTGVLLSTPDGGENWLIQHEFSDMLCSSVFFVNELVGWVVGSGSNKIYHTSNGGLSWESQTNPATSPLYDVFFLDELNGWTVGVEILKTTDGGINWIDVTPSGHLFNFLTTIQFVDESTGWTTGDNATLLKSTDGGYTWFDQWSGDFQHFREIQFVDNMYGWVIGNEGPVYGTSDGGENWVLQFRSYMDYKMYSIFMLDQNTGWIAGEFYVVPNQPERGGIILKTNNGGATFVEEEKLNELPTAYYLSNNFPNPFNPATKIRYSIPHPSNVVIRVFDILGNEIETLVNEEKTVGTYELTWYAEDLPSGVYLYKLQAGSFVETKKMVLLK